MPQTPDFHPRRVLVLSKITRWEVIREKRVNSDAGDDGLIKKHKQQEEYVAKIVDQLKQVDCLSGYWFRKHKIEVEVLKAPQYASKSIAAADLVISAGGDGTFLAAASKIRDGTPVIGINTDPVGSEGHLCLTGKEHRNVADVIETFLAGKFHFFHRQRIRVTLLKPSSLARSPVRPTASDEQVNYKANFTYVLRFGAGGSEAKLT